MKHKSVSPGREVSRQASLVQTLDRTLPKECLYGSVVSIQAHHRAGMALINFSWLLEHQQFGFALLFVLLIFLQTVGMYKEQIGILSDYFSFKWNSIGYPAVLKLTASSSSSSPTEWESYVHTTYIGHLFVFHVVFFNLFIFFPFNSVHLRCCFSFFVLLLFLWFGAGRLAQNL